MGSFAFPWASLGPLLALLWVSLGALFVFLWGPLGPLRLLGEPKSMKNRFKIRSKFQSDFLSVSWSIFDQFWERFGEPEPSKMVFSCRRGAIFEKIKFFRSSNVLNRYFDDCSWSWGPFQEPL